MLHVYEYERFLLEVQQTQSPSPETLERFAQEQRRWDEIWKDMYDGGYSAWLADQAGPSQMAATSVSSMAASAPQIRGA